MILSHLIEYHCPTDLNEALRLLSRPDVATVPLGGGTSLVADGVPSAQAVVDLHNLGLDSIEAADDGLHIGAMVTLQNVIDNSHSRSLARGFLASVARRTTTRNVRNAATVGGTLVSANSVDELLLALLALDAQVVLADMSSKRCISLEDFVTHTPAHLSQATLILGVVIPPLPTGFGVGLERVARTPADRPIVAAAAFVAMEQGRCEAARLILGGVARLPVRLTAVETRLLGRVFNDELIAEAAETAKSIVVPFSDFRASSDYRREMAAVVCRRALQVAWNQVRSEDRG